MRNFVLHLVRGVKHSMTGAARVAQHQVELNSTEIRCDAGEEVFLHWHTESDHTYFLGFLQRSNADDGQSLALLEQACEKRPLRGDFVQKRWVVRELDGHS